MNRDITAVTVSVGTGLIRYSGLSAIQGAAAAAATPAEFPQTAAPTETTNAGTTGTTNNITMPPTVNAGDLLLVFLSIRSTGNETGITTPSGWTLIDSVESSTQGGFLYAKDAAGTEGGTNVDFALSGTPSNWETANQVYRVTDWFGEIVSGVEGAGAALGALINPNPIALTPSWGSDKNLWFAAVFYSDDAGTVSSYSAGYSNGVNTVNDGGVNDSVCLGIARKEAEASSDNPDAFTLSEAELCVSITAAVRSVA